MVEENWRWDAIPKDRQEQEDAHDFRKLVDFKSQPFVPVSSYYLESFPNVLLWDDSGAVEALLSAEERRRAAFLGIPALTDLPGPDLYIDKIDWNARAPQKVLECADASAAAAQRSRKTHRFRKGFRRDVKAVQGLSSQPLESQRPTFSLEDMGQFPPLQSTSRCGSVASALPHLPTANRQISDESCAAIQGQQQVYKKNGDSQVWLAHPKLSGESCQNQSGNIWVHCIDDHCHGSWNQRWEEKKLDRMRKVNPRGDRMKDRHPK